MPSTKLHNFIVSFDNSEEYHHLKQEIFTQDCYYFESESASPVIIDVGAHIGLATLYFKKLFPLSRIMAIEPNPRSYELLRENVEQNRLEDVELRQIAVSAGEEELTLFRDTTPEQWHSTAGILDGAWNETQESEPFTVFAEPLTAVLATPIDLLKMDIEGMEEEVLRAAQSQLHFVKRLMCEFHPVPHQSLARLVSFLENENFTIELYKGGKSIALKKARGLILIEAVRH
ncbi:MAG: FkbM family methyltransferase [bacterium]|nr:FkbM family methyltransferase [bacterium]